MVVCDCEDLTFEDIKEAVKTHGENIEAIIDKTDAGNACECCLEDDCDKVDISLAAAIQKAAKSLG